MLLRANHLFDERLCMPHGGISKPVRLIDRQEQAWDPGHLFQSGYIEDTSALDGADLSVLFPTNTQVDFGYSADFFAPEPSTFALAAFGFIGLAAWGRRQKRSHSI